MAAVPEVDQIREILDWIGFNDPDDQTSIIEGDFEAYSDIQSLNEKYITEMCESDSKRTVTGGKIDARICRTKRLKFMMHWVHDVYRVSSIPSTGRLDQASFLAALTVAGQRADVLKQLKFSPTKRRM